MPKSKYESHVQPKLALIEKWARDGLTHDEIAKNLGITQSTWYKYINLHAELAECLIVGRDVANAQVVNALFQSCIGFDYEEEVMTPKGEIKQITRHAKPNVGAITFWLKNKMPEEWADKQEIEHSGEVKKIEERQYHVIQELVGQDEDVADRLLSAFRAKRNKEGSGAGKS